jgi:hypothetical protein
VSPAHSVATRRSAAIEQVVSRCGLIVEVVLRNDLVELRCRFTGHDRPAFGVDCHLGIALMRSWQ